jgi:hypothetical protein
MHSGICPASSPFYIDVCVLSKACANSWSFTGLDLRELLARARRGQSILGRVEDTI